MQHSELPGYRNPTRNLCCAKVGAAQSIEANAAAVAFGSLAVAAMAEASSRSPRVVPSMPPAAGSDQRRAESRRSTFAIH